MKQRGMSLDGATLQGAARQVLKCWWVVLCLALAVLLGTTGIGKLTYRPQYTSTSTLVIRVKGGDTFSSLSQASQMTAVFSEVFQSTALRDMITDSVGEPMQGSISCSQVSDTNLLNLSVASPTPRQAYLFIQAALQNYEQVSQEVFANAALELVQEPSVPENPSNVSLLINHRYELTALTFLGAVVLVALSYLLRNTVKTVEQAPGLLDGKVLGTIPFERKRGVKGTSKKKKTQALLLHSPLVSMNFAESNRRTATRLEAHLQRHQFKVVMVASVEENEGKSTVAANLAAALAERGKRVLLIDGDFRKPAQWRIFDEQKVKRPSFSDVVAGKNEIEQAIAPNSHSDIFELFQYKALRNPMTLLNSERLQSIMKSLRDQFDYIFVDCSPVAAAADAELWMRHVDTTILVVRQDRTDVRIINDTVDVIWKSAKDFSGFVLNAFQFGQMASKSTSGSY